MIGLYYGEEDYLSLLHVKKIKEEFIAKHDQCDPIVFDCDQECDTQKIIESISAQGLFSSEKIIIIENYLTNTKSDVQTVLMEHLDTKTSDVIIFYENGIPRKNAKLFMWLVKNADIVTESKQLHGATVEKWITDICTKRSIMIEKNAVKELLLYIGNDLRRISHEINKLGSYALKRSINTEDVQKLVSGKIDADIFTTIESVFLGDHHRALTLLKKQITKGDAGFHIFSMYVYQLRTLLLISSVVTEEGVTDKNGIAKKLKIHPFVVQKSLSLIKRTSPKQLKDLHRNLTILDHDVKKGKRSILDALEMFIVCV